MQFAAIKRWQWIVIALFVGVILWRVRAAIDGDLHGDYVEGFGYLVADQNRFENALTQEFQGYRLFKDITVYPRWVDDGHGKTKLLHVVAGRYWSGREEMIDGKPQAIWRPSCFIAQVPYLPRTDLSLYKGGADTAKRFHDAGSSATVLDFLSAMHRVAGVNYSYAWWDAFPMLTWVGGSLLLIGGIWPTLINLLAFGTLTRPPAARAMSLWGVRATRAAPTRPVQVQVGSVDELDEELEAALHGPAEAADEASQTSAPRPLTTAPLDPIAPLAPGDSKEFGADPEDFYPTERHVHRD